MARFVSLILAIAFLSAAFLLLFRSDTENVVHLTGLNVPQTVVDW